MADAGILWIEKHDDKLCFRNPGLLRLPVEQIQREGGDKNGYCEVLLDIKDLDKEKP